MNLHMHWFSFWRMDSRRSSGAAARRSSLGIGLHTGVFNVTKDFDLGASHRARNFKTCINRNVIRAEKREGWYDYS